MYLDYAVAQEVDVRGSVPVLGEEGEGTPVTRGGTGTHMQSKYTKYTCIASLTSILK